MAIEKRSVLIIGGGIFGLTTAWFCAKRGMSVTLVERDTIGAGASGGLMGTLSPNIPETWNHKKQFQLDALLSADPFWAEVETLSGLNVGYGRIGRLIPIPDERARQFAFVRQDEAPDLWEDRAIWRVIETAEYADLINPDIAKCGLIHENLSARIHPRLACNSLSIAVQKLGVTIFENWPVTSIGQACISGPLGQMSADTIVVSAGVDSFDLLKDFIGPDRGLGVKGQSATLLGCNLGAAPQIYANGVYIIPHQDGSVAVGSTSENDWTHPTATDQRLDALIEKTRLICPILATATVGERWAGVRPRGKKPDPILGPVPDYDWLHIATGGFKIGFGIAHECGRAVADMIDENIPPIPPAFLVTRV